MGRMEKPVKRPSAAMVAAARRVLGGRFDADETGELIDAARAGMPALGRRIPPGLNRGARHLFGQGMFVIGLHRALCARGLAEDDAAAMASDVVFEANRPAHAWLHRIAAILSRDPWTRVRWQSRLLCRLYYRPPGWELHEVFVPAGYGLDVTRCAIAGYFRDLGLGSLCEQAICVQDERVARAYGGPAGIRFTRRGTIAGGAGRCDFRYRPAAPPIADRR